MQETVSEDTRQFTIALADYGNAVLKAVQDRNPKWGASWNEMRTEGIEDIVHAKAHRLCFCPPEEKRECLIDLLAYATKRWQRGFER